jgi:hypothetical protein
LIEACQRMKVTPHVAQNTSGRRSAEPDAIAHSVGYAISQQKRKLIEQGFGWAKTVGRMRQVMVRGLKKVDQMVVLNMAAYTSCACALWGRSARGSGNRDNGAKDAPQGVEKRVELALEFRNAENLRQPPLGDMDVASGGVYFRSLLCRFRARASNAGLVCGSI